MSAKVAAIVLAAGASSRLGQPKQLLLHHGEPLLQRAVRLSLEAGALPVFAVLGANFETIHAAIDWKNSLQVVNQDWKHGIATSIHKGVRALQDNVPRIAGSLLLTCDQPRLTAAHLRTLIETFAAQPEPTIVASSYAGIIGTPAAFPREVFADLLKLHGDKGARGVLAKPPCTLIAVPFPGGEVDIDEPTDLSELH
jgi:molybdenum cofactor cytidylyltransferase